jgi:hypothetical protein
LSRYKTKISPQELIVRVAAIVGLLGAVGGTIWWAVSSKSSVKQIEAQRDERTQCLPEVNGLITVLVDRTDAMNENQRESLRSVFQFIKKSVRKDERLAVYPIDAEASAVPATLIEVCAPVSAITENLRRIKQRFDEAFSKPLDKMLLSLTIEKTEKQSPILEVVQAVSVSQPRLNKSKDSIRRELIIFSDLLQHSQRASLYRVTVNADATRLMDSSSVKEILSDTLLAGYDVKVYMLERCGYSDQQRVARAFWEKAFKSAGAISISFPALPTAQKPCPGGKADNIEAPAVTKPVTTSRKAASSAPAPAVTVASPHTQTTAPDERSAALDEVKKCADTDCLFNKCRLNAAYKDVCSSIDPAEVCNNWRRPDKQLCISQVCKALNLTSGKCK